MIFYEAEVKKTIAKGLIPLNVFKVFHNTFLTLDSTQDLNLFDIVMLKGASERKYYRLRKGKFRAIFYIENSDIYVIKIAKREEVYKK